jgi:hypothetical protein
MNRRRTVVYPAPRLKDESPPSLQGAATRMRHVSNRAARIEEPGLSTAENQHKSAGRIRLIRLMIEHLRES